MSQIITIIKEKLYNIFKPITNKLPRIITSTNEIKIITSSPLESQHVKDRTLLYILQVSNNSLLNSLENECKTLYEAEKMKSLQLPDNSPEQRHALENIHILSKNLKIIAEQKQLLVLNDLEYKQYIKSHLSLQNITPYKRAKSR